MPNTFVYSPDRLDEVSSFYELINAEHKVLQELSDLTSIFLKVPISLISLIDDKEQRYLAKNGLSNDSVSVERSICQHTLGSPDELFVVNDALKDERLVDNEFVSGDPKIRFYASAPLVSDSGSVVGTLCAIDTKPRELNSEEQKVMRILAKRAIEYLNLRRILRNRNESINESVARLKKLTQRIPGGLFQLTKKDDELKFEFFSAGLFDLYPNLSRKNLIRNSNLIWDEISQEFRESARSALENAFNEKSKLYLEYKVGDSSNRKESWHALSSYVEKNSDGSKSMYGLITDITKTKEYQEAMEQISFDISHVLRRPVSSLLGLARSFDDQEIENIEDIKIYVDYIKQASEELDSFTQQLQQTYAEKRS